MKKIATDKHKQADRAAGFTLVEMLVALFIFAVISVGTLGSLQSAARAKEATERATLRHETLSLMRATLRADIAQIIVRQNRDAFGGLEPYVFRGGFDELLEFTRLGRVNPGGAFIRSDIQRVKYLVEDGQFIRRALRHENPAPNTPTTDRILMTGIADAQVRFTRNNISIPQIEINLDGADIAIDYITFTFQFEDGRELTQIFEAELL